jgi:membrane-associated phospholipid phosphatase
MSETEIVLRLNGLITSSENLFAAALWLSDYLPWMVCALVLIALWFSRDITPEARTATHQRVLLIALGMLTAFLLVRPVAAAFPRLRPMEVVALPVPVSSEVWTGIVDAVRGISSFPSDQATFWFALVVGVLLWHPRIGLLLGLVMLFFGVIRIALGYIYPTDLLAGACIGALSAIGIWRVHHALNPLIKPAAQAFEGLPMFAYPLGLLFLFDIVQRLTWTISLLSILFRVRLEG